MSTSPLDFPEEDQDLDFEFEQQSDSGLILNILSGVLVAGTLLIGLLFAVIFLFPQSSINPLPPTTLPVLVLTDTPTPTPKGVLPPTWTPTTAPSETPVPTNTPTETPLPPTETTGPEALPTSSVDADASFAPAEGFPQYSANDYKPDDGCSWFGVIGQVLDADGNPVSSVVVEAGGTLGEIEIAQLTLSGMASTLGEGGYEIYFGDQPQESQESIWIQLLDQADLPLSEKVYFDTYDDCERNLIRINFLQEPEDS